RYIVTLPDPGEAGGRDILDDARKAGVACAFLGWTRSGGALILPGEAAILVRALKDAHESWLPAFMAAPGK
ncbi:MAG: hypothetical protein JO366_01980, partial [Methylobacteriaceae bacterium]|nr:hypothetical protein [Methylobacteriaceae bacterium]